MKRAHLFFFFYAGGTNMFSRIKVSPSMLEAIISCNVSLIVGTEYSIFLSSFFPLPSPEAVLLVDHF